MKQASLMTGPMGGAAVADDAPGTLKLEACSATIDDGLLLVFGPDGDPLPPEVFEEAALARPDVSMMLAGDSVPVGRIATVLGVQRHQPLAPPGGDAWLRSMLGLGPTPEEAGGADLGSDGRAELIRFGHELVITTPADEVLLLRAARPDDAETGVRSLDRSGATVGHDALLELLVPNLAEPAPATIALEADGAAMVLAREDVAVRLAPCGAGTPRSLACLPSGESVDWTTFVRMLLGGSGPVQEAAPPDEADGEQDTTAVETVAGPPERLVFDEHGFVDLGWLEGALAASGEQVASVLLTGLPAAVRLSAGHAAAGGWRVALEEMPGLAMFATPENLESFSLEIEAEGATAAVRWCVPVAPRREDELSAEEPLTVALDFPPPFSARNRLDYFAVVMVEGLPQGAALSAGVASGAGRWTLAPDDLRDLRAHFPAGTSLPWSLEVVGVTIENRDGMLSSVRRTLVIGAECGPGPDEPSPASVALDLTPLLEAAGPARRIDAVAVAGVPPVVELSHGTHDRVSNCWVLRSSQLSDVTLTVRDPALRRLSLKARAIAIDGTGDSSAISRTLDVEIPEGAAAAAAPITAGPGFFRSLADRRS